MFAPPEECSHCVGEYLHPEEWSRCVREYLHLMLLQTSYCHCFSTKQLPTVTKQRSVRLKALQRHIRQSTAQSTHYVIGMQRQLQIQEQRQQEEMQKLKQKQQEEMQKQQEEMQRQQEEMQRQQEEMQKLQQEMQKMRMLLEVKMDESISKRPKQ